MNITDSYEFIPGCVGASWDTAFPPTNIRLDMESGTPRAATESEILMARKLGRIAEYLVTKGEIWGAAWSQDARESAAADSPVGSLSTMRADRIALDDAWADFKLAIMAASSVEAVNQIVPTWPQLTGEGN